MKTKMILLAMLLTLLTVSAQAKDVYLAKLSEDIQEDVPNAKSFEAIVTTSAKDIDDYFSQGDYTLSYDEAFVILGGNKSIRAELGQYKKRKIKSDAKLRLDICYLKKGLSGKNDTFVFIRSMFAVPKFCRNEYLFETDLGEQKINLQEIINALVKNFKER